MKIKMPVDKFDRIQVFISYALKASIFALAIISIWKLNFFLIFSSLLVLFLMFIPSIIEKNYTIHLPTEFDFAVTIILWLHFVLGEVDKFYYKIPWWDIFLHYISSFLMALMGFLIVYILFYTNKVRANPIFFSIFTIAFAVALGALWEIFEFSMDQIFGFNMQKSGLIDTMTDLMVDAFGAAFMAALGYYYIKKPSPGLIDRILKKMIKNVKK